MVSLKVYAADFNYSKSSAIPLFPTTALNSTSATQYGGSFEHTKYDAMLCTISFGSTYCISSTTGAGSISTTSYAFTIQESSDSTNWSTYTSMGGVVPNYTLTSQPTNWNDVVATSTTTNSTTARMLYNSAQYFHVNLRNAKKWIRAKIVWSYLGGGALSSLENGIVGVLGDRKY